MCKNWWDPYFPFWESILSYEHTMEPLSWSVKWVMKLHEQWYDLRVVTWRGTMESDETYRWLEKYFPWMFTEVIFGHEWTHDFTDKWVLCSTLGACVHLDDFIQNWRDISAVWIPMLLFDRLRNQSDEKNEFIIRCKWWEDALEWIWENLWSSS